VVDINVNAPRPATPPVFTEEYKKKVGAMTKSQQYQVAKNAIQNGHKPSHKSIKELGIGSGFSQEFLVKLRSEDIIERDGKGHRLIS
jgi:hypothetical protein